jgi:hypothetical protein
VEERRPYVQYFERAYLRDDWPRHPPQFVSIAMFFARIDFEHVFSYIETHRMMREITGFGAGNGPYIMMHDSFQGLAGLAGFTDGADRIGGDVHPYFAFNGDASPATIDSGTGPDAGNGWALRACTRFATMMNDRYVFHFNPCGFCLLIKFTAVSLSVYLSLESGAMHGTIAVSTSGVSMALRPTLASVKMIPPPGEMV